MDFTIKTPILPTALQTWLGKLQLLYLKHGWENFWEASIASPRQYWSYLVSWQRFVCLHAMVETLHFQKNCPNYTASRGKTWSSTHPNGGPWPKFIPNQRWNGLIKMRRGPESFGQKKSGQFYITMVFWGQGRWMIFDHVPQNFWRPLWKCRLRGKLKKVFEKIDAGDQVGRSLGRSNWSVPPWNALLKDLINLFTSIFI